jgi:hypothetical protein
MSSGPADQNLEHNPTMRGRPRCRLWTGRTSAERAGLAFRSGSASSAPYQLASQEAGSIHYYTAGGGHGGARGGQGGGSASQIASWVPANFTAGPSAA